MTLRPIVALTCTMCLALGGISLVSLLIPLSSAPYSSQQLAEPNTRTPLPNSSSTAVVHSRFRKSLDDDRDGREFGPPGLTLNVTLPRRVLTSSKIHKKYGLTNVLLFLASMLAYAGVDDRAVLYPEVAPIGATALLDIGATQARLSHVNVRFTTVDEVKSLVLQRRSAWRLGVGLGSRLQAGSLRHDNSTGALMKLQSRMELTRHVEVLSHGDFFLRFPFYSVRPLDDCFYLKRFVFARAIRDRAAAIVNHLVTGLKARRLLALHLRVEPDAALLDRRLARVAPVEVSKFWATSVQRLVREHEIDAVYVCMGAVEQDYVDAIRMAAQATNTAVVMKEDIPETPGNSAGMARKGTRTTSHTAAAVDLLMMEKATIAVSTGLSTFALAALARRCPSPQRNLTLDKFRGSLFLHTQRDAFVFPPQPDDGTNGIFVYTTQKRDIDSATIISSELTYAGCDKPFQGHCFFHGVV